MSANATQNKYMDYVNMYKNIGYSEDECDFEKDIKNNFVKKIKELHKDDLIQLLEASPCLFIRNDTTNNTLIIYNNYLRYIKNNEFDEAVNENKKELLYVKRSMANSNSKITRLLRIFQIKEYFYYYNIQKVCDIPSSIVGIYDNIYTDANISFMREFFKDEDITYNNNGYCAMLTKYLKVLSDFKNDFGLLINVKNIKINKNYEKIILNVFGGHTLSSFNILNSNNIDIFKFDGKAISDLMDIPYDYTEEKYVDLKLLEKIKLNNPKQYSKYEKLKIVSEKPINDVAIFHLYYQNKSAFTLTNMYCSDFRPILLNRDFKNSDFKSDFQNNMFYCIRMLSDIMAKYKNIINIGGTYYCIDIFEKNKDNLEFSIKENTVRLYNSTQTYLSLAVKCLSTNNTIYICDGTVSSLSFEILSKFEKCMTPEKYTELMCEFTVRS